MYIVGSSACVTVAASTVAIAGFVKNGFVKIKMMMFCMVFIVCFTLVISGDCYERESCIYGYVTCVAYKSFISFQFTN